EPALLEVDQPGGTHRLDLVAAIIARPRGALLGAGPPGIMIAHGIREEAFGAGPATGLPGEPAVVAVAPDRGRDRIAPGGRGWPGSSPSCLARSPRSARSRPSSRSSAPRSTTTTTS